MMDGRLRRVYVAVFCVYLAAVGILCFIRPSDLPEVDTRTILGIPIDKVLHFIMFLPYPVLSGMVFIVRDGRTASGFIVMTILAITGIGIAYGTEVLQAHTGYRQYEIGDFYADMSGIAAGTFIGFAYLTYLRLKK